jgi:hypothetical protein
MLTQEELKNLEVIFTLARQQVAADEKTLIDVINFRQSLFTKLTDNPNKQAKMEIAAQKLEEQIKDLEVAGKD